MKNLLEPSSILEESCNIRKSSSNMNEENPNIEIDYESGYT